MPKILGLVLGFSLFLIAAKTALAITVTVSDYPQTITQDPFSITVSVEGAQTATNYLRVDLYKEGTSSYFGEIYNGTDWYDGSDGKQYYPISIQSGQIWSGEVQARIGEPSSSKYTGPGTYEMRIRRYTASGGQGGENANDSSVSITIDAPAQVPTPSPSISQSVSSTSTKAKSPSPSPKSSPQPASSKKTSSFLGSSKSAEVVQSPASEVNLSVSPAPSAAVEVQQSSNKLKIAGTVAGSGAMVMGLSVGLYLWYKRKLSKNNTDKESI